MTNSVKTSPKKSYYLPGDPSRTPLTHEEFCDIMRPSGSSGSSCSGLASVMHPRDTFVCVTAQIVLTGAAVIPSPWKLWKASVKRWLTHTAWRKL